MGGGQFQKPKTERYVERGKIGKARGLKGIVRSIISSKLQIATTRRWGQTANF